MKKIAFALALILAGSSLIVGLASTDANGRVAKSASGGSKLTRWRASTVI